MKNIYHSDIYKFEKPVNSYWEDTTKENFNLTKGETSLSLYQFNSNIAKHYFCKKCGIYTHHNRKSDPNGMGVNLGCIDQLDATGYEALSFDGRKL